MNGGNEQDLRVALEALLTGSASSARHRLWRETLSASSVALAPGERAVSIGGDANGTVIQTGECNSVFSMIQPDSEAVRQAFGSIFQSRLHQLPPDLGDFTGREYEAANLIALLSTNENSAVVSAVGGMGGMGKSALAIHVAHQLTERYPDAQLFVELGGTSDRPLTSVEAMSRVIRSFEPAAQLPDKEGEIATNYRSVLAGKKALLVLDNARDATQVRPLLPPNGCAMIVTARRVLALSGARSIELGPLSEEEARRLLESIVGADRAGAIALGKIVELCGHLPLALRVAGTFLAVYSNWTIEEYAKVLSDERQRLRRLRIEDDATLDVVASLRLSETQLASDKPELAENWRLLSVFPASFDESAAATVWDVDAEKGRDGLSGLVVRYMVIYDKISGRYRLHDLMRSVAQGSYIEDEHDTQSVRERTAIAARRHAVYYYVELTLAGHLYAAGDDEVLPGLQLFDLERRNVESAQAWAAFNNPDDRQAAYLCLEFMWQGARILHLRQSAREKALWANAALIAAQHWKEREREVGALISLGLAYAQLGDTHQAGQYLTQAIRVADENQYPLGAAIANANLAHLGGLNSDVEIRILQECALVAKDKDDAPTEAAALGNLAIVYRRLKDPHRAIKLCNKSLAVADEARDPQVACTTLGILANAHLDLKDFEVTIVLQLRRLNIARRISDNLNEIDALYRMGEAYISLSQYNQAIVRLQETLDTARKHVNRKYEADALNALGLCHGACDEHGSAIKCFTQELPIEEELGRRDHLLRTLKNLATAYHNAGEFRKALEILKRCRTETQASNDSQNRLEILNLMHMVYAKIGDQCADQKHFSESLEFFEAAAAVAAETGSISDQGKAICNSAVMLGQLGRENEALSRLESGVILLTSAGSPEAVEAQRLLERVRRR